MRAYMDLGPGVVGVLSPYGVGRVAVRVDLGWCAVIRDGRVFCLGSREGDAGSWRTPVEVRWGG